MREAELKEALQQELGGVAMGEGLKNKIRQGVAERKPRQLRTCIAVSAAAVILGGTTAFAGYRMLNQVQINGEVLPELDSMEIVKMNEPEAAADENGLIDKDYRDYSRLKEELGTKLLDSELSQDNPYMLCRLYTDPDSFAIITVDNFILGDTDGYRFLEEENRYAYEQGEVYSSPVSLKADLILSELQMAVGWDTEYLGMSRFVESYTSEQGYKVNILEDMAEGVNPQDYVSKKTAIFVAGGIRYTLSGRVPMDVMKEIVDTMQ